MRPRVLEHDRTGEGEPPLVLLPGGLTGWRSWLPLVPALARGRRVVRIQPLCNAEGLAGRPGDPGYDAATERESIRMTLAEAGISDLHLVGWSNGGRMALDFALAHPRRVRSLTLVEPGAHWLATGADAQAFHEQLVGLAGRRVTDDDLRAFLTRAGLGGEDPEADVTALPQWSFWSSCRQALSWGGADAFASAAAGIEGYERLAIPTLVVRGRSTAPWLHAVAGRLAGELPAATLLELDGDHACILQSPEAFVAGLEEHLARSG